MYEAVKCWCVDESKPYLQLCREQKKEYKVIIAPFNWNCSNKAVSRS